MVVPSQDIAFAIGSGAVAVFLAVSGGFVALNDLPAHVSWLQWLSPCKYTFQAQPHLAHRPPCSPGRCVHAPRSSQALSIAEFEGSFLEGLLDEQGLDTPPSIAANIGALALMYGLLAAAAVLALATMQHEVR